MSLPTKKKKKKKKKKFKHAQYLCPSYRLPLNILKCIDMIPKIVKLCEDHEIHLQFLYIPKIFIFFLKTPSNTDIQNPTSL